MLFLRLAYRSGRRRSRGAVRSFDLLNVLGTLGSQTPGQGSCRSSQRVIDWQRESIRRSPAVNGDLHSDRAQAGFARAGAVPDRLMWCCSLQPSGPSAPLGPSQDRLGCVLPVSSVRPRPAERGMLARLDRGLLLHDLGLGTRPAVLSVLARSVPWMFLMVIRSWWLSGGRRSRLRPKQAE